MKKYEVVSGFVLNKKGERATKGKTIELTEKQVTSMNLINRGKIEPYLTKKQKEELEKQKALEDEE